MKKCSKCNVYKDLSLFPKRKDSKDGHRGVCKKCKAPLRREQYLKNKKKVLDHSKEYYKNNREKCLAKNKKPERIAYMNEYRLDKERLKRSNDRQYRLNAKTISEKGKIRRKEDPIYVLKIRCRNRTASIFRAKHWNKTQHTHDLLGINYDGLKSHLESKFVDGMTWGNKGEWHIDHIIPLDSANSKDELIKLCHYTNLQPLWAIDNLIKSNKIIQ